MPLVNSDTTFWEIVNNSDIPSLTVTCKGFNDSGMVDFDLYKLHVFLEDGSPFYYMAQTKLKKLLNEAATNKIIKGYKLMRVGPYSFSTCTDPKTLSRAKNTPICLYLLDEPTEENLENVLVLCYQIEEIFKNAQPGDEKYLVEGDLVLSQHFTFRQSAFSAKEPEYVSVLDPRAKLLKAEALESKPFRFLQARLSKITSMKSAEEKYKLTPLPNSVTTETSHILRNIRLNQLTDEQIEKLFNHFMSCEDGRTLFTNDLLDATAAIKRCLRKPLEKVAKDIVTLCPQLCLITCSVYTPLKTSLLQTVILLEMNELSQYMIENLLICPTKDLIFLLSKQNVEYFKKLFKKHPELVTVKTLDFALKQNRKDIAYLLLDLGVLSGKTEFKSEQTCTPFLTKYHKTHIMLNSRKKTYDKHFPEFKGNPNKKMLHDFFETTYTKKLKRFLFSSHDPIVDQLKKPSFKDQDIRQLVKEEIKAQIFKEIPVKSYLARLIYIEEKISTISNKY